MELNRTKAIDLAVGQIEKQFGKGAIMRLGEGGVIDDIAVISTGSLGLDMALGMGGVPRGRVIEIYGPESSGKTTLALHIVAEGQKQGGMGDYIDAEHALDLSYAKKLGVKTDDLLISQPDHGEQALEITDTLVRSGLTRSSAPTRTRSCCDSSMAVFLRSSPAISGSRSRITSWGISSRSIS